MFDPKFIGETILLIPEVGAAVLTNGKNKVVVPVEELTDEDLSMCHSEEFFKMSKGLTMRDVNCRVIPDNVTQAWQRFKLRDREAEVMSAQDISDAIILAEYFSDSLEVIEQQVLALCQQKT